jgi:dTDP-4-dehydrorhamnose 3,5-epimerase
MVFTQTPLLGSYYIDIETIKDERGFFAMAFSEQEFEDYGLEFRFPYSNLSFNYEAYTLRGMHYQATPYQEAKLVRCVRGAIYDVIVDLRKDSETYTKWFGMYLTDTNHTALYIPKDFAHGYLTMERSCMVAYQISSPYVKEAERGIMWDEKEMKIRWPQKPEILSDRDRNHSKFVRGLS